MPVAQAHGHSWALLGTSRISHLKVAAARQCRSAGSVNKSTRCLLAGHSYTADHPKVAVFVEPSPFSHVSGMKIRFSNLIKELGQLGSEVTVFTPCVDPPKSYCGAKVSQSQLCPKQLSEQKPYLANLHGFSTSNAIQMLFSICAF